MRYFPGYKEGSLTRILLAFSLFSVFTLLLVTSLMTGQLYASTLLCDRFDNASDCEVTTGPSKLSSSSSSSSPSTDTESTGDSVTENSGTPLMLPDISPTEEDLGGTVPNDNPATTSSGESDSDIVTIMMRMRIVIAWCKTLMMEKRVILWIRIMGETIPPMDPH